MAESVEEMLEQEERELAAQEAQETEGRDFEEGFTGVEQKADDPPKGDEKKEDEPQENQELEAKKDDGEEAAPEDEPEAKKPSYDELVSRIAKLEGRAGELTSRVRAMHRAGSEEAKQQKARIPDKQAVDEAAADPEKWKALNEEYPEWAEGVAQYVDVAEKRLSSKIVDKNDIEKYVQDHFAEESETLKASLREQIKQELRAEAESDKVDKAYPEWKNVTHSEEFLRWLRVQDQDTLKLYESDFASDVVKLLDQFHGKKRDILEKQKNDKRLNGNIPATSRSSVTRTPPKSEQDDFAEGFKEGF